MPNPYDPYDRGTVLDPSAGTLVRVRGERVVISYWGKEAKPGRVGTDASGTKFVVLRDLGRDVEDSVAIIEANETEWAGLPGHGKDAPGSIVHFSWLDKPIKWEDA